MIFSISHRGPDGQGFYTDDYVSLGSCRLSIFDFSEKGNMPMNDNTKRYCIVYNGEIYNFKELKKNIIFQQNLTLTPKYLSNYSQKLMLNVLRN